MSRGVVIAAVVAATLGSAIGALAVVTLRGDGVRDADAAVRTLAIAAPAGERAAAPGVDVARLRAELRVIVHDELAAGRAGEAPAIRTEAEASTEVTAEAASAEREGEVLVDQALARRAWTDDDAREMRRLLRGVTPEQRDQILRRLVPAMNDHRIAFQGHGAPL